MSKILVRDVELDVEVLGEGDPLVLMHGGPGADRHTLRALRPLAKEHTLILYDHRCNGRSEQAPVTTMTWDNLTADADALRERLGFDHWAVLGHSFGGNVALEYALRYPQRLTRLILLDTGGDASWSRENAERVMAEMGYGAEKVQLAHRLFNGEITPGEMWRIMFRIGSAYSYERGVPLLWHTLLDLVHGSWRTKLRPDALVFAGTTLLNGWTVMDRLAEIECPTLVIAGRHDFIFPPEHQLQLAAGIPGSRLALVDEAGHNAHSERPGKVIALIRDFLDEQHDSVPAPDPSQLAEALDER